ncbi:secretory carrier-associated membrane protein 2-like [Oncorhynchus tshawytscha]|uniref:secretory carrier-associated membrane protein 2-like n=1 Tax=Oncorhynchus tshawytscha TaxID=74940 RepID=UPI001C3E4354|nr:secretory carrier-associated membrane protein 2-like [Oncorhynchus tshawytscha]
MLYHPAEAAGGAGVEGCRPGAQREGVAEQGNLNRSDSSFSYFFFVFFCQVVVFIIQSVGITNLGNSGWITSLSAITSNKAVGAIMMLVAYFFTACAVLSVILLRMVHSQYRRTGASFQKAQQEFSQGVLTNKTFQTAATSAVASAAFQGNN